MGRLQHGKKYNMVEILKILRIVMILRILCGGGKGARTHDPLRVEQVLYQLSYASV